jgi:hypothetical protein
LNGRSLPNPDKKMYSSISTLINEENTFIIHELDYGKRVLETWPNVPGQEIQKMLQTGLPDTILTEFLKRSDELGLDPQADDMKFLYLVRISKWAPSKVEPLFLYHYMFTNHMEPCVFDQDEVFYVLMGHLALDVMLEKDQEPVLTFLEK